MSQQQKSLDIKVTLPRDTNLKQTDFIDPGAFFVCSTPSFALKYWDKNKKTPLSGRKLNNLNVLVSMDPFKKSSVLC